MFAIAESWPSVRSNRWLVERFHRRVIQVRFPESWSSTFSGEKAVLTHRPGYFCLDNAFALIEGHPPGNGKGGPARPGRQTKRQPLSARPERDVSYSCILSFARTSMRYRFPNKSSTSMRTDISDGLCLTDANARTRTSVPEYGATVTGVSFRFMKVSSSDDSL